MENICNAHLCFLLGRYLCSFVDSQDLEAAEATDHLYIYVFDSKNLLVHTGFDFIQSVAYKSAEIPCRCVS